MIYSEYPLDLTHLSLTGLSLGLNLLGIWSKKFKMYGSVIPVTT